MNRDGGWSKAGTASAPVRGQHGGQAPDIAVDAAMEHPLYKKAHDAYEGGDANTAADLLREHVRQVPEHSNGWNDLGTVVYEQDDVDEALNCFRKAILADTTNYTAFENLIDAYVGAERYGEASLLAKQWRESSPESARPLVALARLYLMAGDCAAASEALTKAISIEPDNRFVARALQALSGASSES